MARLLTSMWLLLVVSLSSMFFLMGDFLSERKHAEVSSPNARPYARAPRNSGDEASVGLATIEPKEPAIPRAELIGDAKPPPPPLSDDELETRPSLALSPKTERSKPLKSVSVSAPQSEAARPPIFSKKIQRRGLLERRRVGGRFGNRRLFR